MASSLIRWISPCWCYRTAKNHKFGLSSRFALRTAAMNMSSNTKPPPPPSSPWLMLPPAFEGGDLLYNFYSPIKDKILPFHNSGGGESPPLDAKLVGSSHGWLALFDDNSNNVFLSNPISGQHIKLPPIDTLPDPDVNLLAGRGQVSKVILSCSPLQDECRAVMSFGPKDRLAFCAPRAAAAEWTPIGDLRCYSYSVIPDRWKNERVYEDFVYSRRHDLFFCITQHNTKLEGWDLRGPLSPRIDWKIPHSEDLKFSEPVYPWPGRTKKYWHLLDKCFHPKYLVFSDHSDDLFVVVRHVPARLRPDGSAAERIYIFGYGGPWDQRYPYKTIDFLVYKIDRKSGKLRYMEGSLEGMAIFVGMNHSFAVMAKDFPELKADSIYFTDEDRRITPKWLARTSFGGHDNGIFYYRERTISSICSNYPVEYEKIRRIVPPPMWFTPTVLNVT